MNNAVKKWEVMFIFHLCILSVFGHFPTFYLHIMFRCDCCLLANHNNENLYFHVLVVKVRNAGICWGAQKFVVQKLLWFLTLCLKRREKQTTDGFPARLVRFLKTDPAPLQKIGRHMSALDPCAALNCLVLKSRCLQPLSVSLCLSFLSPPPSLALLSPSRSLSCFHALPLSHCYDL